MSAKLLVVALGVGVYLVSTVDAPQPDPASAEATVLAASVAPQGAVARVGHGFSSMGSHMVASTVFDMTSNTQTGLDALRNKLKAKKGADGDRARAAAQTVEAANRMAIQSVYTADPVKAVQNAMKAKNYLDVVKANLDMQ